MAAYLVTKLLAFPQRMSQLQVGEMLLLFGFVRQLSKSSLNQYRILLDGQKMDRVGVEPTTSVSQLG